MKATELSAHNYVVVFGDVSDNKTVWYYSNDTVRVVNVKEPMTYTEDGAKKIESFYHDNLKVDCVQVMKLVDWAKEVA